MSATARAGALRVALSVLLSALWVHASVPEVAAQTTAPASEEPESEDARARAAVLFKEARALMAADQLNQACLKLEEAAGLAAGVGILYNLADCYEKVGRTASAWQGFADVAERMRAAEQAERAKDASERASALQSKLTRLRIDVSSPISGMTITLNGHALPSQQWGADRPVDPDVYRVRVEAPGHEVWSSEVDARGQGVVIVMQIPRLTRTPETTVSPAPAPAPSPLPAPVPTVPVPAPAEPSAATWQGPVGIAGMAVGGAAGLAAGALVIAAKLKADGADCSPDNFCSDDGLQERSDAVILGNLATGVAVGGAVLAAAGFVVWITAPADASDESTEPATKGARLRMTTTHNYAAVDVMWRW